MAPKKAAGVPARPATSKPKSKSKSRADSSAAPASRGPAGAVAAVMSRLPVAELDADFDARRLAQEFAWEAMEARSAGHEEEMLALCAMASVVHRGCVDAQAMLIDHFVDPPEKRAYLFTKIVAIGVEDLVDQFGAKFLAEHMGHMWHELEARPVVRAMSALATAHGDLGAPESHDRAIAVAEEMLRWDGEDRLGIRGSLIGWYLGRGRHEDARVLLARFEDDGLLPIVWGRVLLAFATEGEAAAAKLLPEVVVQNPHALGYMSGAVKIPKEDFSAIQVGGKTEAIDAAESLESALRANPAFRKWLRAEGAAEATVRDRPSSRRK